MAKNVELFRMNPEIRELITKIVREILTEEKVLRSAASIPMPDI